MHLTIVGANGMLGTDLCDQCRMQDISYTALDLPEINITNTESIRSVIPTCDWVVNCAAYTNVDGAETEKEAAFSVNATGPGLLSQFCREKDIPLLHISTDYVFNGKKTTPYAEEDAVDPISVYGKSKLAGERAIAESGCRFIIARTQSLFGLHGHNFIKAITKFIHDGKVPLRVVNDQVSCPTWSVHLAEALIKLLRCEKYGIVHTSSEGACSWYDFACAIVKEVAPATAVLPVPASTYPRPAKRPENSILSKEKYSQWTGTTFPHWQDALNGYLNIA